jgi:ubiquinone/menaquinone biosynthesis C-methylase UbiE
MSGTIRHPVFARYYAKLGGPALDKAGIGAHRRRLLAGLTGQVVELGAGSGMNFGHYPDGVTRVLAVEPEPTLRAMAEHAAMSAPVPIEVINARGEALPFTDASLDAAVVCLVLCSVADVPATLAELRRVVRPGGSLRFFEHVRAGGPWMRRAQRAVDATFWPLVNGGCHTGRDTAAEITLAGFEITAIDRFEFPEVRVPQPASAHILGSAVRPHGAS